MPRLQVGEPRRGLNLQRNCSSSDDVFPTNISLLTRFFSWLSTGARYNLPNLIALRPYLTCCLFMNKPRGGYMLVVSNLRKQSIPIHEKVRYCWQCIWAMAWKMPMSDTCHGSDADIVLQSSSPSSSCSMTIHGKGRYCWQCIWVMAWKVQMSDTCRRRALT